MQPSVNRQWILHRRPAGAIADGDLVLREAPIPRPGDAEVLMRTLYLSLDPTNRIWMSDREQYMEPVRLGNPMRGVALGAVVESRSAAFKAGDRVMTLGTWSDYSCASATTCLPVPQVPGLSAKDVFGIYFVVGPTAYFGLLDIGAPKKGETVVVSAAAGAVGSIAGQIARSLGCRVVGIAGGASKCRWLTEELGFDAAIDYKSDDVESALRAHCPMGIDVYFDNVGGEMLDTALGQMNRFGRIVQCGMISLYNVEGPWGGPRRYSNILMKRLKIQGFIVLDFLPRYAEAYAALTDLYTRGQLKWRFHEVERLEQADKAVRLLYDGGNTGKLLVKVA